MAELDLFLQAENNAMAIVNEQKVLGKDFKVYGNIENPLFLAKDVAEWIEHSNLTVMINSVDEDEKIISRTKDSLGRENSATFLTENGLYEVLMLSRKPIAKEFKKEVKKILHSLRLNGGYIAHQEEMTPEQIVANALVVAQRIIDSKNKEIERQKQQLIEEAPKVEMYNKLVDRSFCKNLRDTAHFVGIKERDFISTLITRKIIYKHAGHYRAYADYADCFELKVYTYGENKTGQQLLVNIKGLELVKKIFKGV